MNMLDDSPHAPIPAEVALETRATLGLLHAVGSEPGANLTQRTLAIQLGVALGFANALIKRCVRKGLIKVSEAPARRYAYYLTPLGFAEKSRLTAQYVSSSLATFRQMRAEYDALFAACPSVNDIILFGVGEMAEIAVLAAQETGIRPACVVAPGPAPAMLCGIPVTQDSSILNRAAAVILTDAVHPQESYDALVAQLGPDRVLAPPLLNIIKRTAP